MKQLVIEWAGALFMAAIFAAIFFGLGYLINNKMAPDWGDVVLAAALSWQRGRIWERN